MRQIPHSLATQEQTAKRYCTLLSPRDRASVPHGMQGLLSQHVPLLSQPKRITSWQFPIHYCQLVASRERVCHSRLCVFGIGVPETGGTCSTELLWVVPVWKPHFFCLLFFYMDPPQTFS